MSLSDTSKELSCIHASAAVLHNSRINHPRIQEIILEAQALIYPESQNTLLLVVGPTGVGKSKLGKYLVEDECTRSAEAMADDAGIIPAVFIEAPSSGEKDFSWRMFYQLILEQLSAEATFGSSAYGINLETGLFEHPRGHSRNTLAALRVAVERGLRARKTKFLVIDEAAHLIRSCNSEHMRVQLDTLKSLANSCDTQIILVGAYDLYKLVSLSGQIARRTHVIHFQRYREDDAGDKRSFKSCLKAFEKKLPQLWDGKLMAFADDLHQNTLGCVGTLCDVLKRAARLAEATGGWSDAVLGRALLTQDQQKQILAEIYEGELEIEPSLTRMKLSRRVA